MPASVALKNYLRDKQWIEAHYKGLSEKYNGKYVAVAAGRVIAVGNTVPKLKEAMADNSLFGSPVETAVAYITVDSSAMLL